MKVLSLPFNSEYKKTLGRMKIMVGEGLVAINPSFNKQII